MNHRSDEARALNQERRANDKERTQARHAGRVAKFRPTSGAAGAWS